MKRVIILFCVTTSILQAIETSWSGDIGGFFTYAGDKEKMNNFSVLSTNIGVRADIGEGAYTFLKLLYFDILPGSNLYSSVVPFLSEAYVEFPLWKGSDFKARLGRQSFTYGSGLLLFDYWTGEDAARLIYDGKNIKSDIFFIRAQEDFIDTSISLDEDYIGEYITFSFEPLFIDAYVTRGIGKLQNISPLWIGGRLEYSWGSFLYQWEGAGLWTEEEREKAFTLELDYISNELTTGLGFFYFSDGWWNPLGYAYVHDDFYNGWGTGFGEVIPWAILPQSNITYFISGTSPSSSAIFWSFLRNISAVNLNISKEFARFDIRFDLFSYKLVRGIEVVGESENRFSIGKEVSLNIIYNAPGDISFGLAGGILSAGDAIKGLDIPQEDPEYRTIRMWFWKNVEF